jgi:hypothetical protein
LRERYRVGWSASGKHHADDRQALGIGERGSQHHRVDDAEHRGVGAGTERDHQHGHQHEPRMRAHAAERVADVLGELRGVLAWADGEQRAGVGGPDPRDADRPAGQRLSMLVAEHVLHVAPVVGAEIERQDAQETAIPAPTHNAATLV